MKRLEIIICCLFISCYGVSQINTTKFDTIRVVVFLNKNLKNSYSILDLKNVEDYRRKILLLKNGITINTICDLQQEYYNGFAVNWIKRDRNGFKISVEYGSRICYDKVFYFVYKRHTFYLSKIRVKCFDDFKSKSSTLKSHVSIDEFDLANYLVN
jgi:hypothetical protein